jgi:hypothetical protein
MNFSKIDVSDSLTILFYLTSSPFFKNGNFNEIPSLFFQSDAVQKKYTLF